jgi:hypothetical protein
MKLGIDGINRPTSNPFAGQEPMYTPPPITGYRTLSQTEVDLMNEIKAEGERLGDLCNKLVRTNAATDANRAADLTWVAVGQLHLQQGIMALVRSVAKPASF